MLVNEANGGLPEGCIEKDGEFYIEDPVNGTSTRIHDILSLSDLEDHGDFDINSFFPEQEDDGSVEGGTHEIKIVGDEVKINKTDDYIEVTDKEVEDFGNSIPEIEEDKNGTPVKIVGDIEHAA